MFHRILVAVDGSDRSWQAAKVGASLAQRYGASLTLLHVLAIPAFPEPFPGAPALPAGVLDQYIRDFHAAVWTRILPAIHAEAVAGTTLEETGDPVETIARVADSRGFDLIVLGSRGLNPDRARELGSVALGVLHRAHAPVLIVRDRPAF